MKILTLYEIYQLQPLQKVNIVMLNQSTQKWSIIDTNKTVDSSYHHSIILENEITNDKSTIRFEDVDVHGHWRVCPADRSLGCVVYGMTKRF